jgi:cation:H+ antiporter
VLLPIPAEPAAFRRDAPALAFASVACVAVALTGSMGRLAGIGFVLALLTYVFYTYRTESRRQDASAQRHVQAGALLHVPLRRVGAGVLLALAGLVAVVAGADFLVTSSIAIARTVGIPETVIGLTVVAVGTSLPELATGIVAAFKRQTDIALGNVIGSNIFNILGILGVTALISPLTIPRSMVAYDVWVLLVVTAVLLVFAMSRARITRVEGAVFLVLYAGYLGFLTVRASGQG